MFEYVLIDLDGTITNSAPGIVRAVKYALEKFGIAVDGLNKLLCFIGPPLKVSFMEFYGLSSEEADQAIRYYREYYSAGGMYECSVYDDIPELLQELNKMGKKLVLATAKPEYFSFQIIEHYGLEKYFYFMAGSSLDETRVHKHEVIEYAMDKCGFKPENAVMVGDRQNDIDGARRNNIKSIGVLYGFGCREELEEAGADIIIDKPLDLLKYV